ncbi:M23 family metallopeptidase [Taibaiella soli]|uniref:M23ase beta-sheet core domain-containing protein n=1 Tax=Taibaiella soli TaxID=1649169 RepID=A0A2W2BAK8_9BACT|nr:M23 family metallopeptidase [Taibaiella soli]PZF72917.1 hypothetical protein DN068_10930 [Taibaiella soli]
MKQIKILVVVMFSFAALKSAAQGRSYPQDYFRNPLEFPIILAGNFGECRLGHFHSGMDIKTKGIENQVVHAAADGYISRIKMEKGGFGHALYITHPNGYTTLYAHLNNFVPKIQQYLRKQQYQKKQWGVDLALSPDQFPVKKGDQIAWSGNTGASTAPHLHFEIRDSKTEHPLNPQKFGFAVEDKKPPIPARMALYDGSRTIYEQDPPLQPLKKKGDVYTTATDTVKVEGALMGIGLDIDDFMEGSNNTIAFYTAEWALDGELQGRIRLDDIGYDETRYLHGYADYRRMVSGGPWIQLLFQLPGNRLDHIYESLNNNKGVLDLSDKMPHKVTVTITDDENNVSTVQFYVRSEGKLNPLTCDPVFKATANNKVDQPNISFVLDDRQLYDDVCFKMDKKPDAASFSDRYMILSANIPVHHYFDLNIKPNKPIPFDLRDKIACIYNDGKSDAGSAAQKDDKGWYKTKERDLGSFRLVADTVPPVITPLTKSVSAKTNELIFKATDALTSVRKFEGTLEDGTWLLFEPRGSNFIYHFDDKTCPAGSHTLTLKAADENGNETVYKYKFNR